MEVRSDEDQYLKEQVTVESDDVENDAQAPITL
jgi:hypothetical protein